MRSASEIDEQTGGQGPMKCEGAIIGTRTRRLAAVLACALTGVALAPFVAAQSAPQAGVRGVVPIMRGAEGAESKHRSEAVLQGVGFSGNGILVALAGGVHADTDTDGLLDAGESIDYHYTLVNAGPSALSALTLSDSFGPVTCPQTTLAVGEHIVCLSTHVVTPADEIAGAVINDVAASGQDASGAAVSALDAVVTQNSAGAAGIRVFKSPDVVSDADGSDTVSAGDLVRYTFLVKNSNAETLDAVTLTEPDPSLIDTPIVCDATTLGGSAFSGNTTGSLVSNDVVLCTADHTVTPADVAAGEVLNEVEVSALAPIAGPVNATGTSLVVIPSISITLAKTLQSGGPVAEAGEVLTYGIALSSGTSFGRSYPPGSIVETVPAGTQHAGGDDFTCAGIAAGSSCSNSATVVVPDSGSVGLVFRVTVLPPAPGAAVITNTVPPPPDAGCDPTEGCTETTPLRNAADLSVIKTGPPVINRGTTLTFTIVARNIGPDAAINARLEDPTPPGLVFLSTSGACSGPFPCALGNMANGESRTLTASYQVPADYAGPNMIVNTVTVLSDSDDPTPGDSSSSSSVLVPSSSGPLPINPAIIPVDARWAMALLVALTMLIGGAVLRREP